MNRSNSLVVGNITLPCKYHSQSYSFVTDNCQFSDVDGWTTYAQNYANITYGIDLDKYQHKVLVMPQ